jgi:glucose-1-phosphate adenylyltransferase
MSDRVLAMVLAGGEGKRLYPLTRDRAKPAVPFGGRYRIIDFVLSNFINSGFYQIKVLTQFRSESLDRHLSHAWRLSPTLGHFVDPVPAQMRRRTDWYLGTADAIYQNLNLIYDEQPNHVCVFGGDHIYKMDIRQMMSFHVGKRSDLTVSALPVSVEEAQSFGVLEVDRDYRIIGFEEKPSKPREIPGKPGWALASMGNYVFTTETLVREVVADAERETSHDFGRDVIPDVIGRGRVFAYDFRRNRVPGLTKREWGYWRDVGNLEAYYEANMDLVSVTPVLNLYNSLWPIHSWQPKLPPAKFVFADTKGGRVGIATDSLVSEGCIVSGGQVNRSILSPGVRVNSYAQVTDSILMNNVNVGRHARIRGAIIDKNIDVPPGIEIGYDPTWDRKHFTISKNGIVVLPKAMKIG